VQIPLCANIPEGGRFAAPAVMAESGRGRGFALTAAALLVLDALLRVVLDRPYPGATSVLLVACGISLIPFLPKELGTPSLRLALLPVLAAGSFTILLTTASIVGIRLTEVSVRLCIAVLIVMVAVVAEVLRRRSSVGEEPSRPARREGIVVAALVAIFGFALASSWDVVDPFPPPGSDWAYYLLYADEVESQHSLLIDNPYAGEDDQVFSTQPLIGAIYGSFRVLDGISSRSLARGLAVVSAITVLCVYGLVGSLWGVGAGLLAAAAYAVAPIRLEPLYWHGLATTFALAFIVLLLLALGLMYRGRRDWRTVALLGFSLACVGATHSASLVVVFFVLGVVLVVDAVRGVVRSGSPSPDGALHSWWRGGMAKPVLAGIVLAGLLGAGVVVHLRLQAADLGSPVSFRHFDRDWLDLETLDYYYSWPFLALLAVSVLLVMGRRSLRRDAALTALASLVVASILVSQLWRIHVPFEYRRVVYYLAPAMVALIGIASLRLSRRGMWLWVTGYAVVLLYIANLSIGLRLPERVLERTDGRSTTVDAVLSLKRELDRSDDSRLSLVVADRCLGVRVQYLLRRPTLVAAEEWQAGFSSLLPATRTAATVVRGGPQGRRLVEALGVRYVLVDPRCTPNAGNGLGGTAVLASEEIVILELPT
jgi:hypothetical protein